MLDESVVVHGDDVLLEAVGRQGGAAGVLGAELLDGEVQIEIDAADPNELCAVRVWHDGAVSQAASAVLRTLFGPRAALIEDQLSNERPLRLPGTESRRMTSFRGGVPYELQAFVSATDSLNRLGIPDEVRATLDLVRHVYALQSGLPTTLPGGVDLFALSLTLAGATEDGFNVLRNTLNDAVALGVLTAREREELLRGRGRILLEPQVAYSLDAMTLPNLRLGQVRSTLLAGTPVGHRAVLVHEGSLHHEQVRWQWQDDSNLEVLIAGAVAGGQLWARAWLDGGTPLAAVPMTEEQGARRALLLVPHQAGVVTVDVAASLDQRLFERQTAALERAYDAGRKAARIERREGELAAGPLWKICAEHHEIAGDFQRSKMAIGRPSMRRAISVATVADHLLM